MALSCDAGRQVGAIEEQVDPAKRSAVARTATLMYFLSVFMTAELKMESKDNVTTRSSELGPGDRQY
jgi:hypothetical protein